MSVFTIRIPRLVAESGLVQFVETLGKGNEAASVLVDFAASEFMAAGAIVALTAKVAAWCEEGVAVEFANHQDCQSFKYLQRMNLFSTCGFDLPEDFERHDPGGRFLPVERIGARERSDPSRLGSKVADVLLGREAGLHYYGDDYDAYKYVQYSVSEVTANVVQHSGGTGYISAQYYPTRGVVRVGIADAGIGIRESFRNSQFHHDRMTDREAIGLALQPRVSSKLDVFGMYGEQQNFGVGLTLLKALSELTNGDFLVLSGSGYYAAGREGNFRDNFGYQGTVCAFTFPRDAVDDFADLMYRAKVALGLIDERRGDHAEMFG